MFLIFCRKLAVTILSDSFLIPFCHLFKIKLRAKMLFMFQWQITFSRIRHSMRFLFQTSPLRLIIDYPDMIYMLLSYIVNPYKTIFENMEPFAWWWEKTNLVVNRSRDEKISLQRNLWKSRGNLEKTSLNSDLHVLSW